VTRRTFTGLGRREAVFGALESLSATGRVDRRQLLEILSFALGGLVVGCAPLDSLPDVSAAESADPRPVGTPSAIGRAPVPTLEVLRKPIELAAGDVLADRRFLVAPDFAWNTKIAAIYGKGAGITIRNVELIGAHRWDRRWDRYNEPIDGPPGIPSGCVGIRLQETPGLLLEDVSVRGFPGAGVSAYGIDEGTIRSIQVSDCFHGVVVEWYRPNRKVLIEGVEARDLWGPPPGKWPDLGGPKGARFENGYIGGDGLALASLGDSTVRNCTVLGEQFTSLKLVNPKGVVVSGITGIGMMVQGTSDLEWKIDREPARDVSIQDCRFDKSLGSGAIVDLGNAIQVSWNVERITIRRCTIRSAGHDGHAIEFAKNVRGRVEQCTIEGFNGMRSRVPAHAINVLDNSSVNDDFATVNRFIDQRRLVNFTP
jgi:hypothetical protein